MCDEVVVGIVVVVVAFGVVVCIVVAVEFAFPK
jgi:hypothetical protein